MAASPASVHVTIPPPCKPRCKPASTHLLKDQHKFRTLCVSLHNAATRGDWPAFKKLMDEDGSIIRASIEKESQETVLHIVAFEGHYDFMKKLLKFLKEDDLYLLDKKGNTAFCLAVAAGKVRVAEIMLENYPPMATLECAEGWSPLRLATFRGHSKMAWFLYPIIIGRLEQEERVVIFFICINRTDTSLYELALKMLLEYPELAEARNTSDETAFHLLAGKPKAFRSAMLKHFLHTCLGKQLETPGLQVLKQLWKIVSEKDDKGIFLTIPSKGKPSNALFIAAKCGNVQFLAELIASRPALIFETDERNRNVFHIGAMYHQWSIFSLVDKLGANDYSILSASDDRRNTILHLAANVAGPLQWDEMVGPAIRMKRDLKWFKDVTKVVTKVVTDCLDKTNFEDKRPGDIFIEKRRALNDLLVNQTEMSWTTLLAIFASSFGIVAALVGAATFVLQQIRSN